MFQDYLIRRAREVTRNNLADVKTLADWKSKRPEVRRQVLYMLGLDPMPKKTPLAARITGQFERDTYRVENQAEASSAIEIPMLRPCAASHGENS